MKDGSFLLELEDTETVNKLGDSDGKNVGIAPAVGLTEGSRDGAALIKLITLELGLDDGTSDNLGDSDGTVVIMLMLILAHTHQQIISSPIKRIFLVQRRCIRRRNTWTVAWLTRWPV